MYINKLDDFIDITINNFYNFLIEKSVVKKLSSDINFVSFQGYIISIIKDFINNRVDQKNIMSIINNESNLKIIIQILKRYCAFYIYLLIAYIYEGERDLYTTNIIESSKNQKDSTYNIDNFYNSENNAKLVSFFYDIKNLLTVIKLGKTIDQIKIILSNNPIKFQSTIELINKLGEDYIIDYFLIKDNMHNIIKTIIFKLIYMNEEKNDIIRIFKQEEQDSGEYKMIEVIYSRESKLADFTIIQKFLNLKQIRDGLAEEIYEYLEEGKEEKELNVKENKDFLNFLINNEILIPITEDFLRYHKDSEKYESESLLRDDINLKERDATKIKYIITKMNKIKNVHSQIYNKNPKLKLDAQNLFYKQLEHKDAVLYNDNEEIKIIQKLEDSEKNSDLDLLTELENLRKYAYVNYKDFSKDGFKMRPTKPTRCIRYTNIKYIDSRDRTLEFRIGNSNLDINIVGFAWNPSMLPLECFTKDNMINVNKLLKNKNGFNAFDNILLNTFDKNKKTLYYWLFDLKEDKPDLDNYVNLSNIDNTNNILILVAELYKTYFNLVVNKMIKYTNTFKELNNYTIENILKKYSRKYLDHTFDIRIKNKLINHTYLNKIIEKKIIPDETDNFIPGKSGNIIKLPILKINKIDKNEIILINKDNDNQIIDNNQIIPVCHHYIKWKEINNLSKVKNDIFSQSVFNFVKQYVRENEHNQFICKSCGEMLNLKKYVFEGTYVAELDTFLTTSLAVGQDLVKIPKYAKFTRTIKNIEKNIEKLAYIVNLTNYIGDSSVIKLRRKMVVKDTIDLILLHTEYLRNQPKNRIEDFSNKYGINKDLTNLFFFELKDDIFLTSSAENDYYKLIKYNNIVAYFIFIILTEMNPGMILGLTNDKRCNYFLYNKLKETLFGKFYIRINQKDKIPALKLPLLCFVIYYLSCVLVTNYLWLWKKDDNAKNQFNPIIQSTIIHTLFDLINTIFEANIYLEGEQKNFLYEILATRFKVKMDHIYNDKDILKRIESESIKNIKTDTTTNTISFVVKKLNMIDLENNDLKKNIIESYKPNKKELCNTIITSINKKNKKSYSNELNTTTNCPDGKFHKWMINKNELVCSLCNMKYSQSIKTITSTEEDYQNIINQLKYEQYKKLLNEYCISGVLHEIDNNNICVKCKINPDTYKYTDKDISKFEKNMKESKEKKNLEMIELTKKYIKKIETEHIKSKKIINKFETRYTTFTKNKLVNYIDNFIDKLSKILNKKIKIKDNDIYLKDTYYYIDHDYMGTQTKNTFTIFEYENKVILDTNNKDFNKDIYYYKDRTKNITVYYDANTHQYLGYMENNKINKQKSYAKIKIYLSIRDKLLQLGLSNSYFSILENDIKNKPIEIILENLIRYRVKNIKQLINRINSIIFRISYNKKETSIYSIEEKEIINKYIKTIKKFNTRNENMSKPIFKHWKYISNKLSVVQVPKNIEYKINNNYIKISILETLNNYDSKLIFFLIYNFNKLLDYNKDKNINSNIALLIVELIQYSYQTYHIHRDDMNIRKLETLLHINAPNIDDSLRAISSFEELVNFREIDDTPNDMNNEEYSEMIYDIQEEMDSLDFDMNGENEDDDGDYISEHLDNNEHS